MSKISKQLLLLIIIFMNDASIADNKISNLITPVSYFIDHIKQLQSIKNNLDKYKMASLVGSSGMGKTQIARMYAYENKDNYNLIWFFDCNLDLSLEFLKLAKIINNTFKANISESPVLVKKEVMNYLANSDKWILIFDNLKIGDNDKVKDLVHWEHNGDVIFCSQDSEMLPYTIKMTPFTQEDSMTLAKNLLNSKDVRDIEFFATEFRGYPVVIVQGIQLLNHIKGLDKEQYKQQIQHSVDKIELNITLALKKLKPSSARLLKKIALINNQSFSKQLLTIIADNPQTVSDDIYQLSKFMFLSNIDYDDNNPIFEMHDVIAQKVLEINGDKYNKVYLEEVITRLIDTIPKSALKGRIFRSSKTIQENFEIILKNAKKYNINIYTLMELSFNSLNAYLNTFDFEKAETLVKWFNENDTQRNFNLLLMDNRQKQIYARYLGLIAAYYKTRYSNYNLTLEYYTKARDVLEKLEDYNSYKYNIYYNLASTYIMLGQIENAQINIELIESMFNKLLVDKSENFYIHVVKAKLLLTLGEYEDALKQIDAAIKVMLDNSVQPNDLLLTNSYLIKADILNSLNRYEDAQKQLEQLLNMYEPIKNNNPNFSRIYLQVAVSKLGYGDFKNATVYINKAKEILLSDDSGNLKNVNYSEDPDLAAAYVTQGDIFFAQDKLREAIDSYRDAQKIYFYLYKDNRKNVAHVSYLYTQGAKAACKAKDLYHYQCFGRFQVREFGIEHPNTTNMLKYCNNYNMDLWQGDN